MKNVLECCDMKLFMHSIEVAGEIFKYRQNPCIWYLNAPNSEIKFNNTDCCVRSVVKLFKSANSKHAICLTE